jgi:hypothetical protein
MKFLKCDDLLYIVLNDRFRHYDLIYDNIIEDYFIYCTGNTSIVRLYNKCLNFCENYRIKCKDCHELHVRVKSISNECYYLCDMFSIVDNIY